MLGRRLVGGGGEARVASPAAAALRDDKAVAGVGEIVQQLAGLGVVDDGADRSGDLDRFAFAALAVAAFAVTAALGFMLGIETEMQQRVVVLAGDHGDVAAAAAVAAAGAAARDVFLAAKRQAAVAAVAGFHAEF